MLDISEILDDEDFIQSVEFGILGAGDLETRSTHNNTNVQPASGATLQRLPEGERTKPTYQVFTRKDFQISNGDYLYFGGNKYRCITTEDWSQHGYYDGLFTLYSGAQDITNHTPDPYA